MTNADTKNQVTIVLFLILGFLDNDRVANNASSESGFQRC